MHSDRTNRTKTNDDSELGHVPASFGARDARIYTTEESLHAAMGQRVLVSADRMRRTR